MELTSLGIRVIIASVITIIVAIAIHQLDSSRQQLGYDRAVAEYTKKENESLKFALSEIERLNNQVAEAVKHADERDKELQAANTRVATISSKLRNTQLSIDAAIATATTEALRQAATSFNSLYGDCRARYESMGRAAEGHLNDVITLDEAWPK